MDWKRLLSYLSVLLMKHCSHITDILWLKTGYCEARSKGGCCYPMQSERPWRTLESSWGEKR